MSETPEGTALLTPWGPAVAGPLDSEGLTQQVLYTEGTIAGITGAFPLHAVADMALSARRATGE